MLKSVAILSTLAVATSQFNTTYSCDATANKCIKDPTATTSYADCADSCYTWYCEPDAHMCLVDNDGKHNGTVRPRGPATTALTVVFKCRTSYPPLPPLFCPKDYDTCDTGCTAPPLPDAGFVCNTDLHICEESNTSTTNYTTCATGCTVYVCEPHSKKCKPDFSGAPNATDYATCKSTCGL